MKRLSINKLLFLIVGYSTYLSGGCCCCDWFTGGNSTGENGKPTVTNDRSQRENEVAIGRSQREQGVAMETSQRENEVAMETSQRENEVAIDSFQQQPTEPNEADPKQSNELEYVKELRELRALGLFKTMGPPVSFGPDSPPDEKFALLNDDQEKISHPKIPQTDGDNFSE